jgi:prevent-host-death family protein
MKKDRSKVGTFEAKTHLSELLRQAASGKSFVIYRHGKPVARLVPPTPGAHGEKPVKLLAAFRSIRRHVSLPLKIRELVEAGRRR